MFEKAEIDTELHARLKAAGFNPLDPQVQAINAVVSVYYAEKTAKVLQQVQEVLNRLAWATFPEGGGICPLSRDLAQVIAVEDQ